MSRWKLKKCCQIYRNNVKKDVGHRIPKFDLISKDFVDGKLNVARKESSEIQLWVCLFVELNLTLRRMSRIGETFEVEIESSTIKTMIIISKPNTFSTNRTVQGDKVISRLPLSRFGCNFSMVEPAMSISFAPSILTSPYDHLTDQPWPKVVRHEFLRASLMKPSDAFAIKVEVLSDEILSRTVVRTKNGDLAAVAFF